MPLWTIHHTPGIFRAAEKRKLASRITDHYERVGLPRFYVVTLFQETAPEDLYVGGEPTSVGVRIVIDHIAGAPATRRPGSGSPGGSERFCCRSWSGIRVCTGSSTSTRPAKTCG